MFRKRTTLLLCLACFVGHFFYEQFIRVELLIVGNITVDVVNSQHIPGGAVSYAASVARAYGVRACVVTAAGPEADLDVFDGHEVHVVDTNKTLVFEHTYTWWGNQRRLRVPQTTGYTLTAADVPLRCRLARTVLLAPLLPADLDAASFLRSGGVVEDALRTGQKIGLMAQGFQRDTDASGQVFAISNPHDLLMKGLGPNVSVFLSDVETDPWDEELLADVVHSSEKLVITRGAEGAQVHVRGGKPTVIPPHIVPAEDTNGAGDTFATAFMIAEAWHLPNPRSEASFAASRAVMQPQSCKPQCAGATIGSSARFLARDRWRMWLHAFRRPSDAGATIEPWMGAVQAALGMLGPAGVSHHPSE